MDRWRVLARPWCTGALAVLVVNDRVLKRVAPGWWTGKLSDLAGVFLAAVALGLLLRRPRFGAALTVGGFAALKVVPGVAEAVAPLLGGVTRRDLTDLLALAAVWPAVRLLGGGDRVIEPALLAQVVAVGCGIGIVLGTTATSCYPPQEVRTVSMVEGRLVAELSGADGAADPEFAVSRDGGATWSPARPPEGEVGRATEACDDRLGCFRTAAEKVEQRSGGGWRTAFAFTAAERSAMRHHAEWQCGLGMAHLFGPVALAHRGDGTHVVVAMGTDGVLHRTPQGLWERVRVLTAGPVSTRKPFPQWPESVPPLVGLAAVVVPVGLALRRRRWGRAFGAGAIVVIGCGLLWVIAGIRAMNEGASLMGSVFFAALAVAVVWGSLVVARRK